MRIGHTENPLGSRCNGSIYTPHHWFGVQRDMVDGVALAGCSNARFAGTFCPNISVRITIRFYRFHQWETNLRVLEITEIKTVPCVPLSHPFVERLIGTIRREYLDRSLFWTTADLEAKLIDFQHYYNGHRTHAGLEGRVPEPTVGEHVSPIHMDACVPLAQALSGACIKLRSPLDLSIRHAQASACSGAGRFAGPSLAGPRSRNRFAS